MKIQMKINSPCTFLLVASPCASPTTLLLGPAAGASPLYLLPLPSPLYLLPLPSTPYPRPSTFYMCLLPSAASFSIHLCLRPSTCTFSLSLEYLTPAPSPIIRPPPQHCPSTFSLDLPPLLHPPTAYSLCNCRLPSPSTLCRSLGARATCYVPLNT